MDTICERIIDVERSTNELQKLSIKIGHPLPDTKKGGDWVCNFTIHGGNISIIKTVYGVDSIQTLLHAFMGIEAILKRIQKEQGVKMSWLGMDNLGFTFDNLLN